MADKEQGKDKERKKDDAGAQEEKGSKKGSKIIVITVALLVIEAVVFGGVFMLFGKPKQVEAEPVVVEEPVDAKIVEVLVLNDRLANDRSGLTYVYQTEIYVQVKKKDETWVTEEIERFRNEIRADLSAVWRTAEPHHFQEPKLESLTRRVEALLRERFDKHNPDGEPVVAKCVVVSSTGMRVSK